MEVGRVNQAGLHRINELSEDQVFDVEVMIKCISTRFACIQKSLGRKD